MKKILFLILSMVLILTGLTGCMDSEKDDMSSMMSQVSSAINSVTEK